ncbi:hypothetical protein L226DRAFT_489919 [Lentinus tigrinus ALCF2SS1-7]|uniref:BTB domain-containing protein n=1 Tax=Lentinus tigrinus ALCF2SS1-6 TaxID=1328759 RepID=A0A5C2S693_9APHY|nr:hypothetical protein L227DRAFT_654636 [Lentinus tigrinus ALCF2SS1-6]RPD72808.1 hypothetical protein L226DRAFT_489919 [Lentinus tigrinus ALCF2SS1-7]
MSQSTRNEARLEGLPDDQTLNSDPRINIAKDGKNEGAIEEHKQDEEFWYEDGNIVLVVGDVKFRVFRGILADHSPVFREMFSLPQPPVEATCPCPVIHLIDSPKEMRHILRVCFPKTGTYRYLPQDPTYDEISSLVRLGHKYQMSQLVDSSIDYLRKYYPSDFDAWNELGRSRHPPNFRRADAIGVVNLARLIGCMDLLLPALLVCCTSRIDVFGGAPGAKDEQLAPDDIRLCYHARTKLSSAAVTALLRICHPIVADTCTRGPSCHIALVGLLCEQHNHIDGVCSSYSLSSFAPLYKDFRAKLCRSCYAMLEKRDMLERREVWKKLPELLGVAVEGWSTS